MRIKEDAALNPDLVPEEAPFTDKAQEVEPKVEEREVVAAMGVPPKKPSAGGGGFREVDVMSLFEALNRDGEAKLSDHYVDGKSDSEEKEESESETKSRGRGR